MYSEDAQSMPPVGVPPSAPKPDYSNDSAAPANGGDSYGGSRDAESGDSRARAPHRPRHAPANPQESEVLGVFGISIRTKEIDLEDEFSRCGRVEKVVIVYDQRSERSRGFGFVTMDSVESARAAIEKLNGVDLHGRRIRVDFSVTKRPHEPTPGQYMGPAADRRDDSYRRDDRRDDRYARSSRDDRYHDRRGRDDYYRDDYRRRSRSRSPRGGSYSSSRRERSRSPRRERAPLPDERY